MKKLFSLPLAACALLALLAVPAVAEDAAPAVLDLDSLVAKSDCAANVTPALAARGAGSEAPAFFRAACVYSKTCGGWSVTGCCAGGTARQEQKRTCEEKCCQGSLCFSSGPITETRCVSGPC